MAIVIGPLLSTSASGQVAKTLQYIKGKAHSVLQGYHYHKQNWTPSKIAHAQFWRSLIDTWNHLPSVHKQIWSLLAPISMTGYNYFLKLKGSHPYPPCPSTSSQLQAALSDVLSIPISIPPLFMAHLPANRRMYALSFAIFSKIYICTGYDGNALKDVWQYDPPTNTWAQKNDFGGDPRFYACSAVTNGKAYVGLGSPLPAKKDWWEYDPLTDIWTQKADFAGSARSRAVASSVNGKIYVGTGYDVAIKKDWWEYDTLGDSWTQKLDLPGLARHFSVSASLNGKVYLGTGLSDSRLNDWWEYDPCNNTWTQKADFIGVPIDQVVSIAFNNRIFLGTGYDGTVIFRDCFYYNPILDTWEQVSDSPTRVRGAVCAVACEKLFIGTGYHGRYKDDWCWQS